MALGQETPPTITVDSAGKAVSAVSSKSSIAWWSPIQNCPRRRTTAVCCKAANCIKISHAPRCKELTSMRSNLRRAQVFSIQGRHVLSPHSWCYIATPFYWISMIFPCQYNWNLQNYKLRDLLGRFEQRDVLWLGWILNREMQARQIKGTGRVIPWSTCAQASMVVSNLFFRHRGMCQLQRWPLPLLVRHQRGIQGLENSRFFIAVAARPGATSASQCEACGKGHLMNWGDGD